MTTLYIVIPCYNEEEMLPITAAALEKKMQALAVAGRITPKSRVVFVDDGSKDGTREVIRRLHGENPLFSGVFLTRNRGHQNALLAGLMSSTRCCGNMKKKAVRLYTACVPDGSRIPLSSGGAPGSFTA